MKKLNLISSSIIFLFFFIVSSFGSDQKDIFGIAKVIDGDTIKIKDKRIRLNGIDAPEIKQECKNEIGIYDCGVVSKLFLEKLILSENILCLYRELDRYKRILGTCYTVENFEFKKKLTSVLGENLNSKMVSSGQAVAYRKYSKDYIDHEKIAKNNKIGIWSGEFDMPWEWRKKNK